VRRGHVDEQSSPETPVSRKAAATRGFAGVTSETSLSTTQQNPCKTPASATSSTGQMGIEIASPRRAPSADRGHCGLPPLSRRRRATLGRPGLPVAAVVVSVTSSPTAWRSRLQSCGGRRTVLGDAQASLTVPVCPGAGGVYLPAGCSWRRYPGVPGPSAEAADGRTGARRRRRLVAGPDLARARHHQMVEADRRWWRGATVSQARRPTP
jgi:hypothetical protein